MDEALRDHLFELETALARRDPTGIDGPLADRIPDDFLEFGASGRTWTATEIRAMLASEERMGDAVVEDFDIVSLGPDAVLATYRMPQPHPANRCSIWVRRDGRWVMRFHQGTRRPDGP